MTEIKPELELVQAPLAVLEEIIGEKYGLWLHSSDTESKVQHGKDLLDLLFQFMKKKEPDKIRLEWIEAYQEIKHKSKFVSRTGFFASNEIGDLNSLESELIGEITINLHVASNEYIPRTRAQERIKLVGPKTELGYRGIEQKKGKLKVEEHSDKKKEAKTK